MSKNKHRLNAKLINSAIKKEEIQKTITVQIDGKNYDILVDQKFKTTKISDMVTDGVKKFKDYEELPPTVQVGFFSYLLIKYFTDLDLSVVKTFKEDIHMMNSLIDLGVFEKIVSEFPEEEISKVNEYMVNYTNKIKEFTDTEEGKQKLEELLDHLVQENEANMNKLIEEADEVDIDSKLE